MFVCAKPARLAREHGIVLADEPERLLLNVLPHLSDETHMIPLLVYASQKAKGEKDFSVCSLA